VGVLVSLLTHGLDQAKAVKRRLAIRSRLRLVFRQAVKNRWGTEIIRNWYGDLKFGSWCGRIKPSQYAHLGASAVQSSYYSQIAELFGQITITETDVLVDVGCGRGRVLNYWLSRGYRNQMIGIELDEEVADATRKRLEHFPNVTILTGSVLDHIPPRGTVFYLYHPFDARVCEQFKTRLAATFAGSGNIVLLYNNCVHVDVFRNDPHWIVKDLAPLSSGPAARITMKRDCLPSPAGMLRTAGGKVSAVK
jgi:SAM-dependent methyltransferase